MRLLFVTPCLRSSGEAITALHAARDALRTKADVHFLASAYVARLVRPDMGDRITELTDDDRSENNRIWRELLLSFRPDALVFADYPLVYFTDSMAPLGDEDFEERLLAEDCSLGTFDQMGYA